MSEAKPLPDADVPPEPIVDLATTKSTTAGSTSRGSVGPYQLLQKLGEGGMGTVYLAEQSRPVNRRVALKIIKPGIESTSVIARFEQERQALAMMDHPHIAKVLDAGTTPEGLPYFVMELVKGVPLTKFCEEQHVALPERLELFRLVCEAVQHAHQKGIIHRDLKPSNVLVALNDGRPTPKIIDFGVAKAVSHKLTERTMFTEVGQMVGTPEYMAPEQAESTNLDVDTRADIYSLGVMLYELLTGSPPFSPQELRAAGYSEMLRLIREVDPIKPSAKLSTSTQPKTATKNPELDPARLRKLVHGDLDWIVMKCLEKDRARRYESASELAQDLRRHLDLEPVLAGPPSAVYRWGKFLRRHRGAVTAAALVLVALTIGIGVSSWQAVLARQAEARALAKQQEAITERAAKEEALKQATLHAEQAMKNAAEATQNAERAEAATKEQQRLTEQERQAKEAEAVQRKQAESVAGLLESLFAGLNREGASQDLKGELLRRLDDFAAKVNADQTSEPLTKARLQNALGVTYLSLSEPPKAIPLLEAAAAERLSRLGGDHTETRTTRHNLAVAYDLGANHEKLLALTNQLLALERETKGADSPYVQVLLGLQARGVDDAGDYQKSLAMREEVAKNFEKSLGPDHPQTLNALLQLSHAHSQRGDYAAAVKVLETAWDRRKESLSKDAATWSSILGSLTYAYMQAGQEKKVVSLQQEAYRLVKERLGPGHAQTQGVLQMCIFYLKRAGNFEQAIALYRESLEFFQQKMGEDHPATLMTLGNLGFALVENGQADEGLPMLKRLVELARARFGEDHPDALHAQHKLATSYDLVGKYELALPIYEQVIAKRTEKLGATHRDTLLSIGNLASMYESQAQYDKAQPLFDQVYEGMKATLGPDHPYTLLAMGEVALMHLRGGRFEEALLMLGLVLDAQQEKLGPKHPEVLITLDKLASAHGYAGQFDKAWPLFEDLIQKSGEVQGAEHPKTLQYRSNLAFAYYQAKEWEKAQALCEEVLAIRRAKLGVAHAETILSLRNLGSIFGDQKKYVEEERILKEVLEIRRQHGGPESEPYYFALICLGANQLRQGKLAEAEPMLRKSYTFRKTATPDNWRYFESGHRLGECLLASNKPGEAKPLLLEAYAGLKAREKFLPLDVRWQLKSTVEKLVKVHEALDDQQQVEAWRKTLAEYK